MAPITRLQSNPQSKTQRNPQEIKSKTKKTKKIYSPKKRLVCKKNIDVKDTKDIELLATSPYEIYLHHDIEKCKFCIKNTYTKSYWDNIDKLLVKTDILSHMGNAVYLLDEIHLANCEYTKYLLIGLFYKFELLNIEAILTLEKENLKIFKTYVLYANELYDLIINTKLRMDKSVLLAKYYIGIFLAMMLINKK